MPSQHRSRTAKKWWQRMLVTNGEGRRVFEKWPMMGNDGVMLKSLGLVGNFFHIQRYIFMNND